MKRALLIMAKQPTPGQTKTRLCPPLSPEESSALYECFLRDSIEMARSISDVTRLIACFPPDALAYFQQLAPDFEPVLQEGRNLRERLDSLLTRCSNEGYDQTVAVSSDNPTLPVEYVAQAFASLDHRKVDVVLGPAQDGGYYLIGWKRPNPRIVREVQMSTPRVLRDTLRIAEEENLRTDLLPTWYDVDDIEDLARLRAELATLPDMGHHTRQFLARLALR
jgi:rSAM/selenodomain-associated transferase 1